MDSKTVTAAIRRQLHPLMKADGGFAKFTGRNAWRIDEQTTSVIYFQSFSSHLADGVGCTTFSFAVRLGVLYRYDQPTMPLPQESLCTFRMTLGKSVRQPIFVPYASVGRHEKTDRPDVFFVQRDGSNLNAPPSRGRIPCAALAPISHKLFAGMGEGVRAAARRDRRSVGAS